MSTSSSQLLADVALLHADSGLMHKVIHGDAATTVMTEGGLIRSVANAVNAIAGFTLRGAWATGTAYNFKDVYTDDAGLAYMVLVPHTSTSISADLGAGKVGVYQGIPPSEFTSRIGVVLDSISALRGLSKTAYNRAFVVGYYGPGDGGGGAYFKAYDVAPAGWENYGTQIVAADGAAWQMFLQGPTCPEMFGARGDGLDDTIALQNWLNSFTAGAKGGLLPGKIYGFTNLTLPQVIPFDGPPTNKWRAFGYMIDGQNSELRKIGAGIDNTYGIASRHWLFDFIGSVAAPLYLKDLNINGNGFATYASLVTSGWNSLFENVRVYGGAGHGHIQDSLTKGGTQIPFSQVNNRWVGCHWYANDLKGFWQRVPSGTHGTDGALVDCFGFDNGQENVRVDNCGGWDFDRLHTWNTAVANTASALASFGRTGDTHWRGCQFDFDSNNPNTFVFQVDGGSSSAAGTLVGCYLYGNASFGNPNSFAIRYALHGVDQVIKGTDAYVYLASARVNVYSYGSHYGSAQPFRSVESNIRTFAHSSSDYIAPLAVRYSGQHTLTKGAAAPYVGGYAYEPNSAPANSPVADGGTLNMAVGSSTMLIFSDPVNTGITVNLPPKASMSTFQPPFRFLRRSGATGSGPINIVDVDTGNSVVAINGTGVAREVLFTGTSWMIVSNTGI